MKIPLGKILFDHGPFAPYGMCDFVYQITLPKSEKIMKAQTNEETGNYKPTDTQLEYEIIESKELANKVRGTFNVGRSLRYDYTTLLKTLLWSKDSTREVIDINILRKKHESGRLVIYEKGCWRQRKMCFPKPNARRRNRGP